MSIRLQHLREAFSFLSTFVGRVGEITVDTTNNRIQVHDGVTAGGWPAAKLSEVVTNGRTVVADANYAALASDRTIAYSAITAARIVTLPAANVYPTGTALTILDESGACSATDTITLGRAGSDMIDGATSAVISMAYGYLALQSNGAGKWTVIDQAPSNLPRVGIGTPADPNNLLSVFGTSALFNSAGDFNFTINKAASSNTASTIYEDGFSGRAQVGLCGDDNFRFKVSPDGATWHDALDITNSSGLVTANFGIALSAAMINNGISGNTPGVLASLYASQSGGSVAPAMFEYYAGGNSNPNVANLVFRNARGTPTSPVALQSGDFLGQFGARGYGTTTFSSANKAAVRFIAAENWSDSAQGTNVTIGVTAPGTTTLTVRLEVFGTGQIGFQGAQADQSKTVQAPATGFSITISNSSTTLLLTPTGTLATGTVIMPAAPIDGHVVRVLSSQTVSALTVSPNTGQSISGAPSAIGPATPFAMIYDLAGTTWYRME
jgi:hypothetical protein